MTPERHQKIHQILSNRQDDLCIVADKVHKPKNLAAIIRTCDAFGIQDFHAVIPEGGYRDYRGTSQGSHKWVTTHLYDDVCEPIGALQKRGFQVVAANLSEQAVDYHQVDYLQPTALLLGTEKTGVSAAALAMADQEIIIPMQGMVNSFNVSVASAIILSEVQRQRRAATTYKSARIAAQRHTQLAFEWSHPVITEYCQRKGLPYPEVDDDGEVINQPAWYASVKDLPELVCDM